MVTMTGSKKHRTRVWTSESPPFRAIRPTHGLGATPEIFSRPRVCRTKTPELHMAGEFPMSCHDCHLEADS